MGRSKEPIDLIVHKGRKHLTKAEIEERKNSEIKVKNDKVKPPNYLPKNLKKEFKNIAKELIEIGIMSNLDIDCLARFLISRNEYLKITKAVEPRGPTKMVEVDKKDEEGNIIGVEEVEVLDPMYDSLQLMQNRAFKQCREAAGDLGLSIASRCKLVIPKGKDEKPKNKFSKFL
ncbi:phage terminase small subunit P27 family [Clostridium baratii]|uniref:phage terminase small subunit P27 family n=1 Tax=Clostridium baratii TaxID=1561 RepID=UPI0030D1A859